MITQMELVIAQTVSTAEASSQPASLIADIEQHIAQAPAIDRQKIEMLKKKLENKEYNLQPERIAEKILKLEQDLFY